MYEAKFVSLYPNNTSESPLGKVFFQPRTKNRKEYIILVILIDIYS